MITGNFPNLMKNMCINTQEHQKTLSKVKWKRPTSRCILMKLSKDKDKKTLLKAARKKQITTKKGLSADSYQKFWMPEGNRLTHAKHYKEKNQPRILYLTKLSFESKGEINTFSDKQKLREFLNIKPALTRNAKRSPSRWNERTLDSK